MFNANADTAKPLVPTAAFGQSAPPPGGAPSRTAGGGLIGNRLPKLDPSGAGVLGRNVAQPVGRKVSESRGLYGNRIPSVVRHHTGGSTGSAGSVGGAQPDEASESVPPPLQSKGGTLESSADLEEDAVDLSASASTVAGNIATERTDSSDDIADPASNARPDIPEIRAEGLVPSTLPHDEDDTLDSDVSQPPSPRSTAAQASETSPSLKAFSENSSVPALSRIGSTLSVGTEKSTASKVTHSSLRVETGADDEDDQRDGEDISGTSEQQSGEKNRVQEDQDNLSDVSTPTGTPTMPARDYLPEIPGTQSHPIGGLSLHPDGTVSPGAFGTARKMPSLDHHDDDVMVDTSVIPDETQKLKHEQKVHEQDPGATETEKNRKGNEPESQGDFEVTEDKMVHIELPEDDPALTEEGRELQRLAKEKLAAAAEERGKSEWEVLQEDSKDRPDQVKREQASANEKETGDPNTSFESVHERKIEEAREKEERGQEETQQQQGSDEETPAPAIQSKDFGAAVAEDTTTETEATMPSDGDKGAEPESPLSNETREHAFDLGQGSTAANDAIENADTADAASMQTPTEVIEPPTPAPDADLEQVTAGDPSSPEEEAEVTDVTDRVEVQDIEDIPTNDDTELHRKDQDPHVESLIVGRGDENPGVEPKVAITEEDSAADDLEQDQSKQLDVGPQSPASVPSDVEEPEDARSEGKSTASFPSVPKQEPVKVSEISNADSNEVSRTPTPGPEELNLPSVPTDNVDQSDSPQGKVRVGVTLSPGKHVRAQASGEDSQKSEDVKRFLAKKDGSGVENESAPGPDSTPSLDAIAATMSDPVDATRLAKSTSSSSTLSSSSSTSGKKKKAQERGRSPLLDMDTDGEDGGEAGWAKVSVNKTKYS